MKSSLVHFVFVGLIIFTMSSLAIASNEECRFSAINLSLELDAEANCKSLDIEGVYDLKLCANKLGLLSGRDGTIRFLYFDVDMWTARKDLLDFTNKVSETEILQINGQISDFVFSKIKSKQNGEIISQVICKGNLRFSQ